MKIGLVISSLEGGGAERVMAMLANAWVSKGVKVTLITLADRSVDVYSLDPAIDRVDLGLMGYSSNVFRALVRNVIRTRSLRSAVASCAPDVVISFMTTTNLLTLLACRGFGCPLIVSERSFASKQPPRGVWRLLYRPLYRLATEVIAQTQRGAVDLEAQVKRRVLVIPNPLTPSQSGLTRQQTWTKMPSPVREGNAHCVLAAGRLSMEKGFDLLIAAFSRIALHHPTWHLIIVGEGPERSALAAQVAALGLADRVHLPGFCDDPQALMRRADLFVLSSRYEGLPNALLEAMATGCPCISFDCESGPAELIEHGVNGWLVPPADVAALAVALDQLIVDASLRERLGAAASEVGEKFSIEVILAQWNELITLALEGRQGRQPSRNEHVSEG